MKGSQVEPSQNGCKYIPLLGNTIVRSVVPNQSALLRFLGPFDLVQNSLVLASSVAKIASATQEAGEPKRR